MPAIAMMKAGVRSNGFEFKPALIPTLAAILALSATVSLGRWQLTRAEEKRGLQEQFHAARLEPPVLLTGDEKSFDRLQFRRLTTQGEFDASRQVYIDNQVENERAGYHVLTPLKLAGTPHYVLVNRGWIERGAQYPTPPAVTVPSGLTRVTGYGALPVKRFLELSAAAVQGNVWQNLTFARYRQATGLDVLPIILVQTTGNGDGLVPVLAQPDFGIAKHQGYAFQWFALSAAIVAIYFYWNIRRVKK